MGLFNVRRLTLFVTIACLAVATAPGQLAGVVASCLAAIVVAGCGLLSVQPRVHRAPVRVRPSHDKSRRSIG